MAAPSDLFFRLTPEKVLEAVETGGLACRNLCYPLNSFENRVYEVELEEPLVDTGERRLIAKFYRPGRWSEAQILEEHAFLAACEAAEIPVCAARQFPGGGTLRSIEQIPFALFDRRAGRAPDELDALGAERLGMLVGRVHAVGSRLADEDVVRHRMTLDADSFVRDELDWLEDGDWVPEALWPRYQRAALAIADLHDARCEGLEPDILLHGDLHLGNVLLREGVFRLLDFDDSAFGPPVQDLWLAIPGRDVESTALRERLLQGYERFHDFDRASLRLVETLRGLRVVRYAAWIAHRWHDPIFPATWSEFGTDEWWGKETDALEEILRFARGQGEQGGWDEPEAKQESPEVAAELTNRDYFWDWEEKK
jgi:Ser/Thr protein kinase RdoA (MazF antagonist)